MEDLQKLVPGFPRVAPQAPFLQVTPNVNFMHNVLPRQNLQPTGQLEYKVLCPATVWGGLCARAAVLPLPVPWLCELQDLPSCCMILAGCLKS